MIRAATALLFLGVLAAAPAAGQADTTRADSVEPVRSPRPGPVVQDTLRVLPITPRGAFIRSMILPGWGQSRFESYFRGGLYFAGWAGNWFMNFRNWYRLDNARNRLDFRTDQVVAGMLAASPNPDSLQAQIDSFPQIIQEAVRADSAANDLRLLVRSREQQQEDWIAWTLFWILASGVDAYVTAHLADFPAEVELRQDRSVSLSLRFPLPGEPRRARLSGEQD